ncbi:hypothetical protein HER10_EVM0006832 [Colletotrichum scovillei]|uniref:uncharacterized protein n=1 Tax=Colletotrichum scovillei TaxID=1209932 RepID=UPI0015C3597F|nr:uncharacterized protein HER10_EVM0006832 [Colletotrichum scovillei]KAF4772803.1 hypothetical protein HER10_EVM0006832 [Colletotrichum scovillei]
MGAASLRLVLCILACLGTRVLGHYFRPETGGLFLNLADTLPTFDILGSQTEGDAPTGGSFWASVFAHASDGHDYLVISHSVMGLPNETTMYRGSIIDITDSSRHAQFTVVSPVPSVWADNGDYNASYPDFEFASLNQSFMRTLSRYDGAEFDITFELSAPALLYGGLGIFQVGNYSTYDWVMPSGRTNGWVSLGGVNVTIDPEKSLTWYDRQWGKAPQWWTWFQLHVPNEEPGCPDTLYSILVWDSTPDGTGAFATVKLGASTQTISVQSIIPGHRNWTSPYTGYAYAMNWYVKLADGTEFDISTIRDDQELHSDGGGAFATYEGLVTAKGNSRNGRRIGGYGVIEMQAPSRPSF